MNRDDELSALRAEFNRLETELRAARVRLLALERAQGTEEAPNSAVPPLQPSAPRQATPPVLPPQEIVPNWASATPPPLPWDHKGEKPAAVPSPWPGAPPKVAKPKTAGRRYGPPADMPLEIALGKWWLPRIGIVMLSLGVMYLVTYTAQWLFAGWMGPYLRIAGGYVVCAVLLGLAKWLESSSRNYARVLASGGFALSYFVTFAAHFISSPPVIRSEMLTLLLLFGVVLAWAAVAQRRGSQLLGLGVILLGHLTIFLSLGLARAGEGLVLPSILLFSLGGAFFLVRNRWYGVGAAGMVCSYINLGALLDEQVFTTHTMTSVTAIGVLAVIYLIHAMAELLAPEELRRRDVRLGFRAAYVALNSAGALGFSLLLWNQRGGNALPPVYVLHACAGVLVLVVARLYYHVRRADPLFHIYQMKGLSLLTLALGFYLGGEKFEIALAVEAVLLLVNSSVTGFPVSRVFSWACTVLYATFALGRILGPHAPDNGPWQVWAPLWISAALLFGASIFYERVDWRRRGVSVAGAWRDVLRSLDLLADEPGADIPLPRNLPPLSVWSLLYAGAALAPLLCFGLRGVMGKPDGGYLVIEAAAGALVMAAVCRALRAQSIGALASVVAAYSTGLLVVLAVDGRFPAPAVLGGVVFLAIAIERLAAGDVFLSATPIRALATAGGWFATILLCRHAFHWPNSVPAMFAVNAVWLAYAFRARITTLGAVVALGAMLITLFACELDLPQGRLLPLSTVLIELGPAIAFWLAAERLLAMKLDTNWLGGPGNKPVAVGVLAGAVCVLTLRAVYEVDFIHPYLSIAWTVTAVALLALGVGTGQAVYRYGGLATFGIVICRVAWWVWDASGLDPIVRIASFIVLGVVLLAVAYGYTYAVSAARAGDGETKAPPPLPAKREGTESPPPPPPPSEA